MQKLNDDFVSFIPAYMIPELKEVRAKYESHPNFSFLWDKYRREVLEKRRKCTSPKKFFSKLESPVLAPKTKRMEEINKNDQTKKFNQENRQHFSQNESNNLTRNHTS